MSLLQRTTGLLALSALVAFSAPAGAEQVFSTVSTGPVHVYPAPAPYPLGDVYYSPCGWSGNYGGGSGFGHGGRVGRPGNTTLTGERFYPFDISSDHNHIHGQGGHGGFGNSGFGFNGTGRRMNCWGQGYGGRPVSPPRRPMPAPYATPRA